MLFEDGQHVYCVDHPTYPDFSARIIRCIPEESPGSGRLYQVLGGVGKITVPEVYLSAQKPITITPSMIDEIGIKPAFALSISSKHIQLFVHAQTPVDDFLVFEVSLYLAYQHSLEGYRNQVSLEPDVPLKAYRAPFSFLKKQTFHIMNHQESTQLMRSLRLRRQQAFIHDSRRIMKSLNDKLHYEVTTLIQQNPVKTALDMAVPDAFLME